MDSNSNSIQINLNFHSSKKPFIIINNINDTSNIEQNRDISSNDSTFKCEKCGKIFKSNWILTRHIIQVENKIKEICKYCGKEFPRLKEHINKYHKNKNKKIKIVDEPKNIQIENIMSFNISGESFSLINSMYEIYDELISSNEFFKIKNFLCFNNLLLGKGKFSQVFFGCNQTTKEGLALKIAINCKQSHIYESEKKILISLKDSFLFPKYIAFERYDNKKILIQSLFGPNLDKLYEYCEYQFDTTTISKIAIDIITALEDLHNAGYLHMDIKPNNIAVILKDYSSLSDNNAKLGLLDLDNSISYLDSLGIHYKKKNFLITIKEQLFMLHLIL